jgi:hypothetical protein
VPQILAQRDGPQADHRISEVSRCPMPTS